MLAQTNDRVNKNGKKGGCEEIKINFLTARDRGVQSFTPLLFLRLHLLFRKRLQSVQGCQEDAAHQEPEEMEGFPGHGWLRDLQGSGPLGDGVQGTDHQSQDEVHHGGPVIVQGVLHQFDDAHDARQDSETEDAQHREIGQVHVEEFLDGVDDGYIEPENQQHGGTGNPRQHHGADGNHGTDEDIAAQ